MCRRGVSIRVWVTVVSHFRRFLCCRIRQCFLYEFPLALTALLRGLYTIHVAVYDTQCVRALRLFNDK
jgi:hypothetical protein